ncbi:hypothetical protein LguiA_000206 [Lonicera macranthoides]
MAGSPKAVARETSAIGIRNQWEVQYSRFLYYPPSSSTHPSLTPLAKIRSTSGNWISASSFSASLKLLLADHSNSLSILTVTFRQQILEEHYISKLHVTWPQVSCVSGYPARGSRVVLLSYKDHIQKFALRFLTSIETEKFINSLKEILVDVRGTGLPSDTFGSEISSQSEFVPSNHPLSRHTGDSSRITSTERCANPIPNSNYEVNQDNNPIYEVMLDSNYEETMLNQDHEGIFTAFPPSFTSLLQNCYTGDGVGQGTAQRTVSEEANLKDQIARYLEDSSFQEMLRTVQKVITEMGDDLLL